MFLFVRRIVRKIDSASHSFYITPYIKIKKYVLITSYYNNNIFICEIFLIFKFCYIPQNARESKVFVGRIVRDSQP